MQSAAFAKTTQIAPSFSRSAHPARRCSRPRAGRHVLERQQLVVPLAVMVIRAPQVFPRFITACRAATSESPRVAGGAVATVPSGSSAQTQCPGVERGRDRARACSSLTAQPVPM